MERRLLSASTMPRRTKPDRLAVAVGARIRDLRQREGMTLDELAQASRIGSKGHLSNVERGLVRPNIQTLKQLADGLGVLPLDLLTFPEEDTRQRLVDATRKTSLRRLSQALRIVRDGRG
jgi:transcriptional regulator with XRE-family HTH domain